MIRGPRESFSTMLTAATTLLLIGAAAATEHAFDADWQFTRGDSAGVAPSPGCNASSFPNDLGDFQCNGLKAQVGASTTAACQATCCDDPHCATWQFNTKPVAGSSCWIGPMKGLKCGKSTAGWVSRSRTPPGGGGPPPPSPCSTPYCMPSYSDAGWRTVETPHDWSSEDLPSRANDSSVPVLAPTKGEWKFKQGDDKRYMRISVVNSSSNPCC